MILKKTKIVCTIGPASDSEEMLAKLMDAGMNAARLNFSHGVHSEHKVRIEKIKKVREKKNLPIGIILDTKGPEVRLGKFDGGRAEIREGDRVIVTTEEILGTAERFSVTYKEMPDEVKIGSKILIADGMLQLEVVEIEKKEVTTKALNSGILTDRKNVNIPGATSKLPALMEKDIEDLKFGIENGIDIVAASFIRKASDVLEIRRVLDENGGEGIHIISKIENREGVDNIDEILEVSDGIMVARGDLGVEIPTEEMPLIQKKLIKHANEAGKPVITATQMLESMIKNPRPTRAEVTDIANAIWDGTDAVMLSGETAIGEYPEEAVKIMASIAKKTESTLDMKKLISIGEVPTKTSVANAISLATCTTAYDLGVKAIIVPTNSGTTARMVSRFRPDMPVVATVYDYKVMCRLSILYGVYPVVVERSSNTDEAIRNSIEAAGASGLVSNGDYVVITAGIPMGVSGTTNMMKVHIMGDPV